MPATPQKAVDSAVLDSPRRSRRIRDTTPAADSTGITTPRQRASAAVRSGSPKASKKVTSTPVQKDESSASPKASKKSPKKTLKKL